ncbi:MAG: methyltransferase domain-containing protein [bacterium]|nr:methyltransferase domain-containing protein [bacterium]
MAGYTSKLGYWWSATYRRKALDRLQSQYAGYYRGVVIDIGGRDRGRFNKPKKKVDRWVFADIEVGHKPDIVLDVMDMQGVESGSVDVVNAIELFEHVADPRKGLGECWRVLKPRGVLAVSTPFLYPIHGDPHDYQRWTEKQWRVSLELAGFKVVHCNIMGRYFFVLADILKDGLKQLPGLLKWLGIPLMLLLDLLTVLDRSELVLKSKKLSQYHGGYFIVAKKT